MKEDLSKYNPEGSTLRKAQLRMLDILKVVDAICQKHNIEYFLDAGSLLGAVRHGGFIPWDDDLDIAVRKEDFGRLCKFLKQELPDNLVFQDRFTDWNMPIIIAKVRDKNSYIYEDSCTDKMNEKGLFIDIFPIEKVPSMRWKRIVDYPYGHCIRAIHNYTDTKDKIISCFVFPFAWLLVQLTRLVNLFIPSDKVAPCYGWKPTYNNYSSQDVFPTRRIPFEGFMARVPNNPDAVLKALYGDYMQIPPEEKRMVHSTKIEFYDE